jgi:hypothetical protein
MFFRKSFASTTVAVLLSAAARIGRGSWVTGLGRAPDLKRGAPRGAQGHRYPYRRFGSLIKRAAPRGQRHRARSTRSKKN